MVPPRWCFAAALPLSLLLGCVADAQAPADHTPPLQREFIFAPDPSLLESTETAIVEWGACGADVVLRVGSPDEPHAIKVESAGCELGELVVGCEVPGDIKVTPEFGEPYQTALVAHEIGHALLGPDHIASDTSIMRRIPLPNGRVSPEDCDRLRVRFASK